MKVCKLCKHLIDPTETHRCPSKEYTQKRNQLINDAARAIEISNEDELEYRQGT